MAGNETDGKQCCVCSSDEVITMAYGGRAYCRGCLEKVSAKKRGLGFYETGALVLLVALGALVNGIVPRAGGGRLLLSLFFLAAVSLTFIILFYRQDRLEPEPKMLVGLVFLGGMSLHLVLMPLLQYFFSFRSWGASSIRDGVFLYIFVYGLVIEYGKYLLIRYTLYRDSEYDETADGVVYGSVVGVGFATAANLGYVFGAGGVDLFVGTVRMATMVLLHASISGLVGYFLARQKFTARGSSGPALALAGAGLLWGGYYLLTRLFSSGDLGYSPWRELILLVVYSFAISALTIFMMHRGQRALLRTIKEGRGQ